MICGVQFCPHNRFWRIAGKWYDLEPFLKNHPGGEKVILLARDRFDDCTFAFEAHHMNYKKVRSILSQYEVSQEFLQNIQCCLPHEEDKYPNKLTEENSFYSDLRNRVNEYFKSNKLSTGPPMKTVFLFWICFALWVVCFISLLLTGYFSLTIPTGLLMAFLGGYGHNWVHQPRYLRWGLFSLDVAGLNSVGWFREHNLQHHMYTNTKLDNHFKGTDPFLIHDPTVKRNFFQEHIAPYLNPVILSFGVWGNYIADTVELIKGNEEFSIGKLILPTQVFLMVHFNVLYRGAY